MGHHTSKTKRFTEQRRRRAEVVVFGAASNRVNSILPSNSF